MQTRRLRSVLYPDRGPAPRRRAELASPDAPLPQAVTDVLPPDAPGYAIAGALGRLLAGLVVHHGVRDVLELGAGSSSLVLARALAGVGGGRITSIEQSPDWCREAWEGVMATPGVEAHLHIALPRLRAGRSGLAWVYAGAEETLARRGPFDLLFVDAPQWYYGRDGALPLAARALAPGALVVLDDAARPQERWTIRRWQQTYPGLSLLVFDPEFGRDGVAILRREGDLAPRLRPAVWAGGALHVGANALLRRARGLGKVAPG